MQFKANVFLSMLAILVLCLLLSLGNWQLDRAQEKKDLLDLQHIRMNLDPVELPTIEMENGNVRYLPVKLTGWVDTKQQILIDNQVRKRPSRLFRVDACKTRKWSSHFAKQRVGAARQQPNRFAKY
jgi:Uncharacterized conserved protein